MVCVVFSVGIFVTGKYAYFDEIPSFMQTSFIKEFMESDVVKLEAELADSNEWSPSSVEFTPNSRTESMGRKKKTVFESYDRYVEDESKGGKWVNRSDYFSVDYVDDKGTIEGAPDIKPEHLPVFDCAFRPANGTRSINYMGHLQMMGAAQPFISGAISKTVNLPKETGTDEIFQACCSSY